MKIVLATENQGKLAEFQDLFATTDHSLVSLAEFDVEQADETGTTFVENAILKARSAAAATGLPCLADDSGLSVAALGGAPGIYSARYASADEQTEPDRDKSNVAKLLNALSGHTDRRAHFYCALVLMRSSDDPAPLVATGQWHGTISDAPSGSNGFGYDPVFVDSTSGQTAAQMTSDEKRARSHRGLAWQVMAPLLPSL